MSLTKKAHDLIRQTFKEIQPNVAIDATCGNGHDSVFLSRFAKQIICFDIQEQAILKTHAILQENAQIEKAQLIQKSHVYLSNEINTRGLVNKVDIIMFNLGYLPNSSDLSITTSAKTSVTAIKQSLDVLSEQGVISILCYRGHQGGTEEYQQISTHLKSLDKQDWKIAKYQSNNANEQTPVLLFLSKLAIGQN